MKNGESENNGKAGLVDKGNWGSDNNRIDDSVYRGNGDSFGMSEEKSKEKENNPIEK